MGNLAIETAQHAMGEHSSAPKRRLQQRHKTQCRGARRGWALPPHPSGATAPLPGAVPRWDDWQITSPAVVTLHASQGRTGPKNLYCPAPAACPFTPGVRNFPIAIYFEATSRWDSQYDGLLINVNKRLGHNFSYGLSYTWSKSIDDGPNPSFVLIPQDSQNFRAERAVSSDDVRNRVVVNGTVTTPKNWNPVARDFLFSLIATIQSPMRFTKFAGFDANGDIFGNNDRVGIEPRNTFIGDNFRSVDFRIARTIPIRERKNFEVIAEAFNLFNTTNIRFFNTVYGASDFCPVDPTAFGCTGATGNLEGSPNPLYGTPRAVFNPRQIQLALKFNF